ncbi:MAG: hypothetical protein QXD04_03645 [Candidatus Bathyarchaeia archaeon]|nr:hypothetical protein [Candidatus Bathyarchaeota archaeon]
MSLKPYHYVRFTWLRKVDLRRVAEELERRFEVEQRSLPSSETEFSLFKDEREGLKVKADTLAAFLYPMKAVLYQREASPFTARDLELRRLVLQLYPRSRPTPLPWSFSSEPKFEIAQKG